MFKRPFRTEAQARGKSTPQVYGMSGQSGGGVASLWSPTGAEKGRGSFQLRQALRLKTFQRASMMIRQACHSQENAKSGDGFQKCQKCERKDICRVMY